MFLLTTNDFCVNSLKISKLTRNHVLVNSNFKKLFFVYFLITQIFTI